MDTTKTELNLFDLIVLFFRWIGRLCAGLWKLCGRALQLTYRQWWIVCLLVALGIGAALYLSRPSRRYYKAEATAIINGPTSMTIGQALKPVMQTTSAKLSEAHTLSSVLGLSDSVAAHVRQIDWFPIVDCLNDGTPDYIDYKRKAKMNDTTNVISDKYVQLRVMTYRPAEIPIIEKALLDYLNNLPSLQESYELYQHAAGGIYESVTHQVAYLDSLGRRLYVEEPIERKLDIEKGHIMVGDGVSMISKDLATERKQLMRATRKAENMTAPVVLLTHFSVAGRAENNRLKCLVIGILLGYLCGLLCATLFEQRRRIGEFLRRPHDAP